MINSWCRRLGLTAMLLTVSVAAQAQNQSTPQVRPGGAQGAAAEDAVVATIDGAPIRMSDVELAFRGLPAQYRNLPLPMIFGSLVQQLIDRQLVANAAEAANLADDPEVANRLALARRQVLQQIYLARRVNPELSEDKLRARYEADIASKPGAEEVSARHILVATEEEADAVVTALKEGADFAEQAKEKSIGPSGPRGGDLGFFKAEDMVPEFSQAAFALQAGETSRPVKTEFGWHVIRVDERRAQPVPTFEESVDQLRQTMAQEVVAGVMEDLRGKAEIETFNADGTPQIAPAKE
ncbi:MAG: peptidylprolyl isomerase [Alphaproteobacteria bacterium]